MELVKVEYNEYVENLYENFNEDSETKKVRTLGLFIC